MRGSNVSPRARLLLPYFQAAADVLQGTQLPKDADSATQVYETSYKYTPESKQTFLRNKVLSVLDTLLQSQ